MNGTIDTKQPPAARGGLGRRLRGMFQEWVFQLALVGAVVVTLLDGVASLNRGTII